MSAKEFPADKREAMRASGKLVRFRGKVWQKKGEPRFTATKGVVERARKVRTRI